MLVKQLVRQESLDLLARTHVGRLACARADQPYVVPISFVYYQYCLYSFTTIGQKTDWMRTNPLVGLQVDEIVNPQRWTSVVITGRYEELPDSPQWSVERETAQKVLQENAAWWLPGYAKVILQGGERSSVPLFFRLHISEITGRIATP